MQLRFVHLRMEAAHLAATMGQGPMSFDLKPPGQGASLAINAADFGALCHVVGVSDHVSGGTAKIVGQVADDGAKRRYWGTLDAADYRMVRAPAMTKLLSLVSFSSILSQLRGAGIPFDAGHADFTLEDGLLKISGGHGYGSALGLNAAGWIDLDNKKMSLDGTIIPAYMFNSMLGDLPLVGTLLSGGKHEGLFAANFTMAGNFDDPGVSANPLSILAPGVLRDLFLFKAPGNAKPQPAGRGG
jgi:hypothetical protein